MYPYPSQHAHAGTEQRLASLFRKQIHSTKVNHPQTEQSQQMLPCAFLAHRDLEGQ